MNPELKEMMDACKMFADRLKERMDTAERDCMRSDKGHWIARTAIPAGGKIERKIKQAPSTAV